MKISGKPIRHAKQRGEWAELRFMTRAIELGFRVTTILVVILRSAFCARRRTWACRANILASLRECQVVRSARFQRDVAIEHGGRFRRVQVKCTIFSRGNSYKCHLDSNGVPYSPADIDFVAAYVIPTDSWYILPIRATNHQPDILLTPHSNHAKYEKYKEAWHLLKR